MPREAPETLFEFRDEPTLTNPDWPAITDNFYRSPSGNWVYKWADEHLILAVPSEDVDTEVAS